MQEQFRDEVHRRHSELCGRGMDPNAACALALRVAAGQASMPVALQDVYATLQAAKASEDYRSACAMLRAFFASPDALHASFWRAPATTRSAAEDPQHISPAGCNDTSRATPHTSATATSSSSSSSSSSSAQPWLQIDASAVQELHDQLQACGSEAVRDALLEGGQLLLLHISDAARSGTSNPGLCRQVCGLLANPWLEHCECHSLLSAIAGVLVEIEQRDSLTQLRAASQPGGASCGQQLRQLYASWQAPEMRRVVVLLQQYITVTLYDQQAITGGVEAATQLLGLLSSTNSSSGVLDAGDFYNDAVNEPDFNIKEDYKRWKTAGRFSFCSHPWIYDPASKARILQLENQTQQLQAFESSMMMAFMGGWACPFLMLRVRRGPYLLRDTLMQINSAKNDGGLKKPLKVKFVGEEGVDEGGPQKEFFQLLVRQCFNVEFGMFVYSEETQLHWFHASSMDLDTEFELIGILIGLAIYNGHILEFQFPLVLYKKLLGQELGLADLAELYPDIHRSLTQLLSMEQEQLESLALTFQVEAAAGFGEVVAVDLKPGGADISVGRHNVAEYVQLYVTHLLAGSIQRQFSAFQAGFLRLCSGSSLQFFRPSELEQLVCGGRIVDLAALEAATVYEDGYTALSRPVRWFWEVVHALDQAKQKRLLFFITGSDRVPIKGLGHLSPPFVISRNGADNTRLPTAHTCFNHLLLPAYKDKDSLQQRLLLAIENAEGFGLL